jgi:hypothetical protein
MCLTVGMLGIFCDRTTARVLKKQRQQQYADIENSEK